MSRAVFLIDRMMGWVGLDGRSFIALLSSYACAIPGMMATRNIPDPRNRITTILIAPFMTCSARLPVYTVLIAAFIPSRSILYVFNLQGLVMLGLYLVGALSAFLVANILRRGLMSGRTLPFYIELPSYRWPTFGLLLRNILEPVVRFLKRAGTVILAAAIVLWFLLNFPNTPIPPEVQKAGKMAESNYRIDHSYAAMIGKQIEPVIAPLGFDWRIGIGLIASLAAREVLITTMAQVYSVKADEDEERRKLSQYLSRELKPPGYQGDNFIYSLAVALALLAFFVYALQCVSTLAVMRRETGQWKWPIFAFVGMLALAYLAAFVVFRVTILFA
jgi:ferrous iron transport protein B